MNNFNSRNDLSQSPNMNDEIDLIELVAVLWSGKWVIVCIVVVFGISGFIFLKTTSSVYRVETTLDQPSEFQLQRLQPSKLAEGESFQVGFIEPETVYLTALAQSNSLFVQKLFWENYTGQKLVLTEVDDEQKTQFKDFVENFKVTEPDLETPAKMLAQMMLETEDPTKAQETLKNYVKFIDKHAVNELVDQLREGYMTALARLESEYQSIEKLERLRLEDDLTRLREAHDLAESLNIVETPYEQVENVALNILDNRQYILGTRALSEEIKSLEARQDKPLFAFVPALRDMQRWREQIELDLQKLDESASKAHAFIVVSPPEASLEPIKPNKPLILVAILFAAGILGVVTVFTREGIRSYKARSATVE